MESARPDRRNPEQYRVVRDQIEGLVMKLILDLRRSNSRSKKMIDIALVGTRPPAAWMRLPAIEDAAPAAGLSLRLCRLEVLGRLAHLAAHD